MMMKYSSFLMTNSSYSALNKCL